VLIFLGVNGLSNLLFKYKIIEKIFQIGGIFFLLIYGTRAFVSSFKSQKMDLGSNKQKMNRAKIISQIMIVSLLNPHTYLDHCVVMASVAASFSSKERISFSIGAIIASFIWFFSLVYGAGYLSKFFNQEKSWKILDLIIAITMYAIAISLMFSIG
jgi:L-lysine exporter family protein LysE/ArgO